MVTVEAAATMATILLLWLDSTGASSEISKRLGTSCRTRVAVRRLVPAPRHEFLPLLDDAVVVAQPVEQVQELEVLEVPAAGGAGDAAPGWAGGAAAGAAAGAGNLSPIDAAAWHDYLMVNNIPLPHIAVAREDFLRSRARV